MFTVRGVGYRMGSGNDRARNAHRVRDARRLLLAQTLVLLAGGVTTWVVASLVGPPLFREHLHMAGVAHDQRAIPRRAGLSACDCAVDRGRDHGGRVGRVRGDRLPEPATAAFHRRGLRSGLRGRRGPLRHPGGPAETREEFDELAVAFNRMAQRLQSVESTRRQLFGDLAHEIRTPVSVLEATSKPSRTA